MEEVAFAEPLVDVNYPALKPEGRYGPTVAPPQLYAILAPGTLPGSFQAACRAVPLASAINSSTDHWS